MIPPQSRPVGERQETEMCSLKFQQARLDRCFKSRPTNTLVELSVPEWELEILRQSDGKRAVREILAPVLASVAATTLKGQLYLLYQMVLDLMPPATEKTK